MPIKFENYEYVLFWLLFAFLSPIKRQVSLAKVTLLFDVVLRVRVFNLRIHTHNHTTVSIKLKNG